MTEIGEGAFDDCASLRKITLPSTLKTIGNSAFHECEYLEDVTLPNSLESLGEGAFASCGKTIGHYPEITYYGLKKITVPDSVKVLNKGTFSSCVALESVILQDGVTKLPVNSVAGMSCLKAIYIPRSVTEISYNAFGSSSNSLEWLHIYYAGTSDDWANITKTDGSESNKEVLDKVTYHYDSKIIDVVIPTA